MLYALALIPHVADNRKSGYILRSWCITGTGSGIMSDTTQTREPQRGLTFEDVWAAMMDTDKKFKETERLIKDMAEKSKLEWEEIHRLTKETDRKMQETGRQIGKLGNRFGEMVEYMIVPNLVARFKELGFEFNETHRDTVIANKEHNIFTEVDAFLENGDKVMIVEIKNKPTIDDIKDHVKRMI
jgi:hypothetical protein